MASGIIKPNSTVQNGEWYTTNSASIDSVLSDGQLDMYAGAAWTQVPQIGAARNAGTPAILGLDDPALPSGEGLSQLSLSAVVNGQGGASYLNFYLTNLPGDFAGDEDLVPDQPSYSGIKLATFYTGAYANLTSGTTTLFRPLTQTEANNAQLILATNHHGASDEYSLTTEVSLHWTSAPLTSSGTDHAEILDFEATGALLVLPPKETVQDLRPWRNYSVEVDFDFAPHGSVFSYTIGPTTWTPTTDNQTPGADNVFYQADFNTELTFTPTVRLPNSEYRVIEYYWDFGDGHTAYGDSVTHTYIAPGTWQAFLRVTDNKGRRWFARKEMYILGDIASMTLSPHIGTSTSLGAGRSVSKGLSTTVGTTPSLPPYLKITYTDEGTFNTLTTSTYTTPVGVTVGQLQVVVVEQTPVHGVNSWPAGWTEIFQDNGPTLVGVAYRVAQAGDAGTVWTVSLGNGFTPSTGHIGLFVIDAAFTTIAGFNSASPTTPDANHSVTISAAPSTTGFVLGGNSALSSQTDDLTPPVGFTEINEATDTYIHHEYAYRNGYSAPPGTLTWTTVNPVREFTWAVLFNH